MAARSREYPEILQAPYRPFGTFRFVLALAVVFGHSGWLAGDALGHLIAVSRMGSAAVLCFFVLSGFILAEAASTFYKGRWQALALNRVLKIVPGFLGALILSLIVHFSITQLGLLDRAVAFEGIHPRPAEIWTISNVGYNLLSIVPVLRPDEAWYYFGHIYLFVRYVWAINAEVMFYLLLAIYVALAPQSWAVRAITMAIAALSCVILASANLLTLDSAVFYIRFAPFFLLGITIYLARRTRSPGVYFILGLAALASVILGFDHVETTGGGIVFVLFLMALVALSRTEAFFLSARTDRRLGDLSYSLYLNHYAVLVCLSAATPKPGIAVLIGGVLLSVAIAAAMQLIVERPLTRVRALVRGVYLGDSQAPARAVRLAE